MVRRAWQQACALRDAGYRVSVISIKGAGFEQSHETIDGIEIYRHRVWEASGALGYLLEYSFALAAQFCLALKIYFRTRDRKSTRLNSSHSQISYAVFCLKKKKNTTTIHIYTTS